MGNKDNLTAEQKILLLASRVTFSEDDERELARAVHQELDWSQVIRMASKHQVLSLFWTNVKARYYWSFMPKSLVTVLRLFSAANRERNAVFMHEIESILREMNSNDLLCVPVKGAHLLSTLYTDGAVRYMGDIDFLIKKRDVHLIRKTMNSLGYLEGDYDFISGTIKKPSRETEVFYQMGMNQLMPFAKLGSSEFVECISAEFRFALDYDSSPEIASALLSHATRNESNGYLYLRPAGMFIHLCCNIYKDAFSPTVIFAGADLRLRTFCDVREYYLQFMRQSDTLEAIRFAKSNGLEKPIYFALYCLKLTYNDGYEDSIMKTLQINDPSFIEKFGARELGYEITWKKDFWQRLFSDNNKDALTEIPKQAKLLGFSR